MSTKEIIIHINWYLKFLHLKECQKKALEKWKKKKELFKKTLQRQKLKIEEKKTSDKLCNEHESINKLTTAKINRCLIKDQEDAEFESIIEETLNLDALRSGSGTVFSEVEIVHMKNELKGKQLHFEDKITKLVTRQPLAYRLATEQWKHRCSNSTEDNYRSYMDVETLAKRRIPNWRLGIQAE